MKNDQQEAFERVLTTTLARVLDFLKFAEAKNAALLTFSSAWIIGSINFLNGSRAIGENWVVSFTIALPLFVISGVISLISFLPRTKLMRFHKDPEQSRALLYFGDAALFETSSYRDRIRERYHPPEGETATRNYLDDLSVQIAVNSQITKRKLTMFNCAAFVVLAAIATLIVPALVPIIDYVVDKYGI